MRGKKLQKALELHRAGDFAGAEALYRSLLREDPDNARARYLHGVVCLQQGRYAAGRDILLRCLARNPADPDVLFSLGRALLALDDAEVACARLETASRLAPRRADIWSALGDAHARCGRVPLALNAYARAVSLDSADWRTRSKVAMLQIDAGDIEQGRDALRRLAARHPDPGLRLNLAIVERTSGNQEAAGRLFAALLEDDPDNPDILASSALQDLRTDHLERGWQRLSSLDDAAFARPLPAFAYAEFALHGGTAAGADTARACRQLEAQLAGPSLSVANRCQFAFALGRLRDRRGEIDAAFDAIEQGNALVPTAYDPIATERRFARLAGFFSADRMPALPRATRRSGRTMFIVGMPRSGTSLVEQMLDSHPGVAGAGELEAMRQIERGLGENAFPEKLADLEPATLDDLAAEYIATLTKVDATTRYVSDKLPRNFERLGLIAMLFPDARIVHCVRDPLDTCLSCYFHRFAWRNEFTYSQAALGHFYGHYVRLMDHWRAALPLPVFDLRYEELVTRPRETVGALLDFLGLPWDDRCLAFHENRRIVTTASREQVRRPLYTQAVGRAETYRHRLGPLIEALAAQGVTLAAVQGRPASERGNA